MPSARQTSLALDPPKERVRFAEYFLVGGWPEFSQWIDPRSVPLCDHDHGKVDFDLMRQLVNKALAPSYFRWACLTSDWRGYPEGTRCLVYGINGKVDLWVLE